MTFSEIIGHEHSIAILRNVIRRDRVHHAWLFAGIPGIGRRTVALAFAQALNCLEDVGDAGACGRCSSCKKIEEGMHPDVLVVGSDRSESVIKVDTVRASILKFVSLRRFEGRYRVVIIVDAERFHPSAANALLKTLEEPPPGTIFVLTAANLNALLPTIRSRCQKIYFRPLGVAETASFLRARGISAERAEVLARVGDGSLGRALDLDDEDLEARRRLGRAISDVVLRRGDPLKLAESLSGTKAQTGDLLTVAGEIIGEAAALVVGARPSGRCADLADTVMDVANAFSFSSLDALYGLVDTLRGANQLNVPSLVILERLFAGLTGVSS